MDEQESHWETFGPDAVRCVSCGDVFAVAAGFQRGHVCRPLPIVYRDLDVPVIDGFATLPDGRKIASSARVVRVPYLDAENAGRLKASIPEADAGEDDDLD